MNGLLRRVVAPVVAGVALAAAGCGSGPDEGIPNPALGPPPVIKSERTPDSAPSAPKTAPKAPRRA